MRKCLSLLLAAVLLLSLTACGGAEEIAMAKEGIAPVKLSQREQYLLESFGMSNTAQIISFKAPEEAVSMKVRVRRLNAAGEWETYSGGGISIGMEREPVDTLSGLFAMELTENYGIKFHLNAAGLVSFQSDEITLEQDIVFSSRSFLQEFREIELNQEIPVAVMVYTSADSIRPHSPEDFFDPSRLAGMDLVQAVTLEFLEH